MMAMQLKDEPVFIRLHWYLALINRFLYHWQGLEHINTRLHTYKHFSIA